MQGVECAYAAAVFARPATRQSAVSLCDSGTQCDLPEQRSTDIVSRVSVGTECLLLTSAAESAADDRSTHAQLVQYAKRASEWQEISEQSQRQHLIGCA